MIGGFVLIVVMLWLARLVAYFAGLYHVKCKCIFGDPV